MKYRIKSKKSYIREADEPATGTSQSQPQITPTSAEPKNTDDSTSQRGTETGTMSANSSNAIMIKNRIAELDNQKLQARTDYENKRKTIETNQLALKKQLAEMNENIDFNVVESERIRFSRKLFESLNGNITSSMADMFRYAFDNADVSCSISSGTLNYITRLTIDSIKPNMNEWSGNHWDDVENAVSEILRKTRSISLSEKEIGRVIALLKEEMKKSKLFEWIFGTEEEDVTYSNATEAKKSRPTISDNNILTINGEELSMLKDYYGDRLDIYCSDIDEVDNDTYILSFEYPQYKYDIVNFLDELK